MRIEVFLFVCFKYNIVKCHLKLVSLFTESPTCEADKAAIHVGGAVVLDALFPVGAEGNQGGMQTGRPAQLRVGSPCTVPNYTAASNVSSVITVSDMWT